MDFNKNQLDAIRHIDGPCCVIAGAGSGKTAVLINRIIHLIQTGVSPGDILAVTFSKKAAEEMKSRLCSVLGVSKPDVMVCTFHSLGYNILKNEPDGFLTDKNPIKEYQKLSFIEKAMAGTILETQEAAPKHIASFIDMKKSSLVRAENASPDAIEEVLALFEVYKKYEAYKAKEKFYDYADMEDMPVYRMTQNFALRSKISHRWQYVLVDEYQDTSKAQDRILQLIKPANNNVFAVGDDYQSIYSFRGANVRNILDFPKNFPGARMIYLDVNYRSTPQIVNASNTLIKVNKYQYQKNVASGRIDSGGLPVFTCYEDERTEAESTANKIMSMVQAGSKHGDFAVLYRVNFQSRALEAAFLDRHIPYKVQGGTPFFEQRYIVDIVDYLRLAVNPDDSGALLRVLNRPNRFFGEIFRKAVTQCMDETKVSARVALFSNALAGEWRYTKSVDALVTHIYWLNKNRFQNAEGLVSYVYDVINYLDFLKSDSSDEMYEERLENVDELLTLSNQFRSADEMVDYVDRQLLTYKENADNPDSVTLSTVHKIKGLEFPSVFIVSCIESLFPHRRSEDVEEERRLMYVAMTRAENTLDISAIKQRREQPAYKSRFIDEMQDCIKVANLVNTSPQVESISK